MNLLLFLGNMPFFTKFGKGLKWHITHEYSDEMATKSEVVSIRRIIIFLTCMAYMHAGTFRCVTEV